MICDTRVKMPECAIFSPSLVFHFKNNPKVGVYHEKFKTGKLGQQFFHFQLNLQL